MCRPCSISTQVLNFSVVKIFENVSLSVKLTENIIEIMFESDLRIYKAVPHLNSTLDVKHKKFQFCSYHLLKYHFKKNIQSMTISYKIYHINTDIYK